ncbi:hypothetical protein [Methylobacterium pseudosasicola]|uniref:Uncharacterized protein n=1 Tax=Methylobacterium pseudosasicola TaxID=582667 RepID=A0A1I4FD40_9HYPH|nr:hypothetical protein [Methylobacterium pseudosasicola]SFL15808.1 hypothetical protein SAMN05192568_1001253 [Methylobacterium pseudosasicola]
MNRASDLDAIADACIAAHAVIDDHGTPQMKMLIRVLLHVVAREIAQDLSLSQAQNNPLRDALGSLAKQRDDRG